MIRFKDLTLALSSFISAILALSIFWASNKGFEFTDESYYILTLTQPDQSSGLFYYQHVLNFLFAWMNPGLVGYRLIRLFLTMLAAWFLGKSLWKWSKSFLPAAEKFIAGFQGWFFLSFIGLALSYSIYPQCPSYNSLSVITLAGLISVLLDYQVVTNQIAGKATLFKSIALISFAVVLVLFVKFTTGIIAMVIALGWILTNTFMLKSGLRSLIQHVGVFFLGLAGIFLVFSAVVKNVFSWIAGINEEISVMKGHDFSELMEKYNDLISVYIPEFVLSFLFYPLAILAWRLAGSKYLKSRYSVPILFTGSLLLVFLAFRDIYSRDLLKSGVLHLTSAFRFFLAMMLISLALLPFRKVTFAALSRHRQLLMVSVLMILIPVAGSIGTDNYLNIQVLQYAFCYLIVIGILTVLIFRSREKWLALTILIFSVFGSAMQTYSGLVESPYRIAGTLFDQNMNLNLENGDKLLVNANTRQAVLDFKSLMSASGFQKNDPMIVLNSMPGFIYVADGSVTGNAWNLNENPGQICYNLRKCGDERLKNLAVLTLPNSPIQLETLECMKEHGVNLESGYKNIGNAYNPVFGLNLSVLLPLQRR